MGHNAVLHGCTVEDGCLIGMGAILMNHCEIGAGSIIGAGALVTEHTVVAPGSLVVGAPARVVRPTTPEEEVLLAESVGIALHVVSGHMPARSVSFDFTESRGPSCTANPTP